MKVVHVESGRYLYGGALQVLFLLRGLRERGADSVLVCPPGSAIAAAARADGLRVEEVPLRGDHDLPFVTRLRALLIRERPDVLHLHSRRGADVLGGIAGRLTGVPTVLSRRVDNPEPRWLVRLKYRLFARVVTISEGIRWVLEAEGVPRDRLVCVPSAVDTAAYRPRRDTDWFRAAFGLEPDELTVGMIAQFIPRKGHATLVDAAQAVLAQQPRTRFLLFGQGPERQAVEARVVAAGLNDRFVFAGFREDLDRILPNLDVIAHPAEMEGLGVSLLQASACGVPVVACPVGGIPEAVVDGVTGTLVAPRQPAALAEALSALLTDRAARQQFGDAGRAHVEARFSLDAMVAGNLAVYDSLTADPG